MANTTLTSIQPVYPYVIGPRYYGAVQAGNTGLNSGYNIINEPVITYTPGTVSWSEFDQQIDCMYYPNPTNYYWTIVVAPSENSSVDDAFLNELGQVVLQHKNILPGVPYAFNLEHWSQGAYYLRLQGATKISIKKS